MNQQKHSKNYHQPSCVDSAVPSLTVSIMLPFFVFLAPEKKLPKKELESVVSRLALLRLLVCKAASWFLDALGSAAVCACLLLMRSVTRAIALCPLRKSG